jgi:PAS domain S-box-containing protein
MTLDAQSLALTQLLVQASTQHLRLTLEPLPVGLIEITEEGIVEAIDESTAQKLCFSRDELRGKSITSLLESGEADFSRLLKNKQYGSLFQAVVRTQQGRPIIASIVLEPALQSHKFVCSVIFTTDIVAEVEQEQCVRNGNDESIPQMAAMHNRNLIFSEMALLVVALILLLICILFATTKTYLQFGF